MLEGHILRVPLEEIERRPDGNRWCFACRKRCDFEFVARASKLDPDIPLDEQTGSYYPPVPHIECASCGMTDGDLFPGTTREWE